MAKLLDKVLVIDVEATCWDGKVPEGETSEIIEIGVAVLDTKTCEPIHKEGILVIPEYSKVSEFCTSLTTITPEMLENAMTFKEACRKLRLEYNSQRLTWASYGDYDRRQFVRDTSLKNVGNPLGTTHLNVKNLLALSLNLEKEVGMGRALEILDIPLEGTHHRGVDDANNIAKILGYLLKKM